MTRTLIALLLLAAPALIGPALISPALISPALADEKPIALSAGSGADVVEQNCSGCHSLDYVRMNAPFLTADVWKAEVTKMRTAFGASIDDADAAKIIAYLTTSYGPPK